MASGSDQFDVTNLMELETRDGGLFHRQSRNTYSCLPALLSVTFSLYLFLSVSFCCISLSLCLSIYSPSWKSQSLTTYNGSRLITTYNWNKSFTATNGKRTSRETDTQSVVYSFIVAYNYCALVQVCSLWKHNIIVYSFEYFI
jgi:hypothetical protein